MTAVTNEQFRDEARAAFENARAELASGDERRLRYAALELRFALEALTYDRLYSYRGEIAVEFMTDWQPKRVIDYMCKVDPEAFQEYALAFALLDDHKEPTTVEEHQALDHKHFGDARPIPVPIIKKHYDALGSFLHARTVKQRQDGKPLKLDRLRARCEIVADAVDKTLSATLWSTGFARFADYKCGRCNAPNKYRERAGTSQFDISCVSCGAPHTVEVASDTLTVNGKGQGAPCSDDDCDGKVFVWGDIFALGVEALCDSCGAKYVVAGHYLGRLPVDAEPPVAKN